MLTTSQAARLLQISPATVRNYTARFAKHLSERANPPAGQQRRLTQEDVALLSAAKSLLAEGLTYEQANERLAVVEVQELEPPPDPPSTALVPVDSVRLIIQPYIEERDRVLAQNDALQQEIRDLERQVGELTGRLTFELASHLRLHRPSRWRVWWERFWGTSEPISE